MRVHYTCLNAMVVKLYFCIHLRWCKCTHRTVTRMWGQKVTGFLSKWDSNHWSYTYPSNKYLTMSTHLKPRTCFSSSLTFCPHSCCSVVVCIIEKILMHCGIFEDPGLLSFEQYHITEHQMEGYATALHEAICWFILIIINMLI